MNNFDRLFREHFAALLRYLERQLGDRDAAEEIAQETFLRALRHEPHTNERAWLFTVATNLLRDAARRDARQRRQLEALHDAQVDGAREIHQFAPDAVDETSLVRRALAALSERDRSALLLSEEGLTYEEIAAALRLSPQSVGTTLTRARKRLMQHHDTLAHSESGTGGNDGRL